MKAWMKKSISGFLAVLMTLSCSVAAAPNTWVDAAQSSTAEMDSAPAQPSQTVADTESLSENAGSETSTPPENSAAVYAATDLIYGEGITRAEWLHNLAVVFEMTVEENNCPDDYYADVTSDHPYYRDILLAVEFGVVDLPAGENLRPDEPVNREFAASTLNYCLGFQLEEGTEYTYSDVAAVAQANQDDVQIAVNRNWFALHDGAFQPTASVTDAELRGMMSDAQQVWNSNQIDEDYQSSYTYQSGVIEVPQGTEVLVEENTVTIFGGVSIQAGDVFVVYVNGLPQAYTASSVSNVAGTLTIAAQPQEIDDYLIGADAQGSVEADLGQFVPAEGVEVRYEYEDTAAQAARIDGTISIKSIDLSTDLNLGDGVTAELSCNLTDMKLDYEINTQTIYAALSGKIITDLNFSADVAQLAGMDQSITLGYLPVAGVGQISVVADLDFSGSVTFTAVNTFKTGFDYTPGGSFRTITSFKKQSFTICAQVEADVGVTAQAGLADLPCVSGFLYASAGVKGGYDYQTYDDGNHPTDCGTFYAYLYADSGVSASIRLPFIGNKSYHKSTVVWDRDNSPVKVVYHYEEGLLVPECTRGNSLNYFTPAESPYALPYGSNVAYTKEKVPFTIYEYQLDASNLATITGYHGNVSAITIPSTLDGYPVVAIGESAFAGRTELTSVTIPDSVTSIVRLAFSGCTNLRKVTLSQNLTSTGWGIFQDCAALKTIEIPNSLTSAGIRYMSINYSNIGTFYQSGLETAVLEEGCTEVIDYLFAGAGNLKEVTIPSSVTRIGKRAFGGCTSLSSIVIEGNVTTIASEAFNNCTGLTSVILQDGITTLENNAFYNCTNLSYVDLSNTLIQVRSNLFNGCDSLKNITIPKSLSQASVRQSQIARANEGPFYGSALESVTFQAGRTEIPDYLFAGAEHLREINIPETVTRIGKRSFGGCKSLTTVVVPAGVTVIDDEAFNTCTKLETISLPEGLLQIGSSAFYDCSLLDQIALPQTLQSLGSNVFTNCTSLSSISLPDGVTTMGTYVFSGCANLTWAKLSDGLTSVGDGTFQNCTNLKEVAFPSKAQSIGDYAFDGSGVENISLPDSVESIGNWAFYQCAALRTLQLGQNLNLIDREAFRGCTALTGVVIPAATATLDAYCFADCANLSSVTFEDGRLTAIPTGAFYQCPALTEIRLPYSVTSIEDSAFGNCTGLTGITIPRRVESISTSAFNYPDRMTIYGVEGTYAQTFADQNGYTFVAKDVPAVSIEMENQLTLLPGFTNSVLLRRTVTPEDYTDEVVFRSSDDSIVTVSDTGLLTGKAPGTATVKITIGDASASCTVTVVQPVTSISLPSAVSLEALETRQISCTVRPNNANNKAVTWTSSDETVATVDQNGVVTGLKKGTATITATAQDGSGVSGTCAVTITNSVYQAQTVEELESFHNYENNCSDVWVYTLAGASSLQVTFDERTEMEESFDYLLICDEKGSQIGRYTGTELAGATITVPGDTVRIQIESDEGGTAWGFKVVSVVGDEVPTEPVLTGISVNTLPQKTVYAIGETFDSTGLTLTAKYSDGSSQTISQGYTLSAPDLSTAGEKMVTVSYLGQETSFSIQVKEEITSPTEPDFNQDGIVDVLDAMVLAQCIVDSSTLPGMNLDINEDGMVDVLDVMTLVQHVANG